MKNKHFIIFFALVSVMMIIGGYINDQGGTTLVGVIFGMFALGCAKLTIERR